MGWGVAPVLLTGPPTATYLRTMYVMFNPKSLTLWGLGLPVLLKA